MIDGINIDQAANRTNPLATYFIGVDGGATKCTVSLEDEAGNLLGHAVSGPANIRISVTDAWQSIHEAIEKIRHSFTLTLNFDNCQLHAGVGIAGCEIESAYQAFIAHAHPFATLAVTNDAETACLGAHGGHDGALIIAGTGVVGYQIEAGQAMKVAGWGFPHDDVGGGAWLGLQAVKAALRWQDNRQPVSELARAVLTHFHDSLDKLVVWANQANSTAYAELAPLVIQSAENGDQAAVTLLQRAAQEISEVGAALLSRQRDMAQPLPCALVGGIAPFLVPYLSKDLSSRLTRAQLPPEAGAILYARRELNRVKELT